MAKTAAKAIKNDPKTAESLLDLAKETPHFQAAANSVAKRQAVKQALILKFWQPLGRFAGASSDYFNSEFPADLTEKMKNVPDEEIQTPKPNVAMPALEALAYSVEEAELKEMYLNLLARASDKRTSSLAHPGVLPDHPTTRRQ
ncbi:Abi-alpha family protein [Aeromicrobium sp. UC242_57]|uniref:Abi-alpha family protein n=1 Tax=Aeromicrobium sp. UC242_57 TaxID=3374624 RepID=UPI0037C095D7